MRVDPEMELCCDCRTPGAQSVLITAKEMGVVLKVVRADITRYRGFVSLHSGFFQSMLTTF